MDKPTQEKVAALLFQWEELKQSGEPVTPESLCPDSPEMLEELKRQIKVLSRVNELLNLVSQETPDGNVADTQRDNRKSKKAAEKFLLALQDGQKQVPGRLCEDNKEERTNGNNDYFDNLILNKQADECTDFVLNQPRFTGYKIISELGRGGMGVVYRAFDENLDQVVAIKMVHQRYSSDAKSKERFRREAQLLARLRHEHIVRIYTADLYEGYPYFVMEYHGKGSLSKHLKEFSQPEKAAQLVAQIASAIDYAHRQGVLHRDLKPANILLDSDSQAVVSDFGLAKLSSEMTELVADIEKTKSFHESFTVTGSTLGTPAYMAPEQYYLGKMTTKIDIWALGVILYELVSGNRPFKALLRENLAKEVVAGLRDDPHKLEPSIPLKLSKVIRRCMANDPDKRYSTAGELARELESLSAGKTRRAFMIAAGILLAGGGVATGYQFKKQADLDEKNKSFLNTCDQLRKEIAKNKTIDLLSQEHLPRAYTWPVGSQTAVLKNVKQSCFSQIVKDTMMIDLINYLINGSFKIMLKMNLFHLQTNTVSRYGIFLSREMAVVEEREVHFAYAVMIDIGSDGKRHASLQVFGLTNDVMSSYHAVYITSAVEIGNDAIDMILTVSDAEVSCSINNAKVIQANKEVIIQAATAAIFNLSPSDRSFKLGEINTKRKLLLPLHEAPLGLYVHRLSFEIESMSLST